VTTSVIPAVERLADDCRAAARLLQALGDDMEQLPSADLDGATALRRPLGRAAWLVREAADELRRASRCALGQP
jgi:hypothetical protein